MAQRPKRGGGKSPRDSDSTLPGSLRARDGGGTTKISADSVDSGDEDTDLVETKSQETLLALQLAIDGLSQSQLLSVKDMVQKAAQPTRAEVSSTAHNCRPALAVFAHRGRFSHVRRTLA